MTPEPEITVGGHFISRGYLTEQPDLQQRANETCFGSIREALDNLKLLKPGDRSELDRRYAVTITEMEKVMAYFWAFVMSEKS